MVTSRPPAAYDTHSHTLGTCLRLPSILPFLSLKLKLPAIWKLLMGDSNFLEAIVLNQHTLAGPPLLYDQCLQNAGPVDKYCFSGFFLFLFF